MSWRFAVFSFVFSLSIVTALFWSYLNLELNMQIQAKRASVQLPAKLPLNIQLNRYFHSRVQGQVQANVALKQYWQMPLKGRYQSQVDFKLRTPIQVNIDYATVIAVNQVLSLHTDTNTWHISRFLPNQQLNLQLPLQLRIPIRIQKQYQVPIDIMFHGPVQLDSNDTLNVAVQQHLQPILPLNDVFKAQTTAQFAGQLLRPTQHTPVNMYIDLTLPLTAPRPTARP